MRAHEALLFSGKATFEGLKLKSNIPWRSFHPFSTFNKHNSLINCNEVGQIVS